MNDIEQLVQEWFVTHTDTAITMAYLFMIIIVIAMVIMTWIIAKTVYKIYTYKKQIKKGGMRL